MLRLHELRRPSSSHRPRQAIAHMIKPLTRYRA